MGETSWRGAHSTVGWAGAGGCFVVVDLNLLSRFCNSVRRSSAIQSGLSELSEEGDLRRAERPSSLSCSPRLSTNMSASDFTLLREAADESLLPSPEPLPALPRETVLLVHHRLIEQEAALDRAKEQRTRRVLFGPGKHFSNRRLDEMVPANLGDGKGGLMMDQTAKGELQKLTFSNLLRTQSADPSHASRQGTRAAYYQSSNQNWGSSLRG